MDIKNKRFLVIGGAGLIGSHTVELLLKEDIREVVIFDNDTPIDEILNIKPDIIVKGGDYTVETVVGHEIARVEIFPIVEGYSTTETIEKLNEKI